jgi:hypothetical protein
MLPAENPTKPLFGRVGLLRIGFADDSYQVEHRRGAHQDLPKLRVRGALAGQLDNLDAVRPRVSNSVSMSSNSRFASFSGDAET